MDYRNIILMMNRLGHKLKAAEFFQGREQGAGCGGRHSLRVNIRSGEREGKKREEKGLNRDRKRPRKLKCEMKNKKRKWGQGGGGWD